MSFASHKRIGNLFRIVWLGLFCAGLSIGPLQAQEASQEASEARYLTLIQTAVNDLRAVEAANTPDLSEEERTQLRQRLNGARSSAQDAVTAMQKELDLLAEREAQLGAPSEGEAEAPDILAQRQALARDRGLLDSAIKRGRLVVVEAEQMADRLRASRAEQISSQASERVTSLVSPQFWGTFSRQVTGDVRRISRLSEVGHDSFGGNWRQGAGWLLGSLLLTVVLAWPVRKGLKSAGQKVLIRFAPATRIRRSLYAVWRVSVETLLPLISIGIIAHVMRLSGMIHVRWEPIISAVIAGVVTSSFIISLSGALLMRNQASWRLLPVTDDLAAALRRWTWALGGLIFVMTVLQAVMTAMSASTPLRTLIDVLMVAALMSLFAGVLISLTRIRAASVPTKEDKRTPGIGAVSIGAWLIVAAGFLAILLGYVGFSLLLMRLLLWAIIVLSTLYLLWVATDDILTTVFCATSRTGQGMVSLFGVRPTFVDQVGVVLSGVVRLSLLLLAVAALLFPFGTGVSSVFDQLARVARGITIGEITLSPGALARALIVLTAGIVAVRMFQSWLDQRYLPKTELDTGARNSISLITRYAGFLIVGLWAMASLGIGVERIALLLSALSVGIGFGLQAITQNFVSGLILLAERPVKIGDLVRIGNDEGDVRRINVRSTEIVLGDHSTLIVPNSELITKSVLNKTHSNPLGRIQIEFSVPIGVDVAEVRSIVLSVFTDEPQVLENPEPVVFIDRIADARVMFNSFGHVSHPRNAYGARSAVLLDLLQRFHANNIEIGTVPQKMELLPAAPVSDASTDTPLAT